MYNYNGVKIIHSPYWPKVQAGFETVRFKADPIICWLAKFFPIAPFVEATYPRFVDSNPIYFEKENAIYCSTSQAQSLKENA